MNATLFLSCFVACTFSFIVFGIAGYQLAGYFLRRAAVKHLPKIIHEMHTQAAAVSALKADPAAEIPDAIIKCYCGREQLVPIADVDTSTFLSECGWRFGTVPLSAKRLAQGDVWNCPFCSKDADRAFGKSL